LYRLFCRIFFHRVYFRFQILFFIIIILYIHSGLRLVYLPHWFLALIILYHTCSLLDITYYLSACSCMPVLTIRFSIHALLIQIYRYTCACPCTPLGIHHTTHWGVSDSPDLHVQIPMLGAYGFSRLLIRDAQRKAWIIGRPSEPLSFQAPCSTFKFSFCDS